MNPSVLPPPGSSIDGDEGWELCNDDGFVYRRRKRRRIADTDEDNGAGEASRPPDPELDPVEEERNRRERKRRILMKLKSKYQREIEQWEILSNSLNAMEEKGDRFQTPQREEEHRRNTDKAETFRESSSTETARERSGEDASAPPSMLDELLFMAEAQEAIINDVSNLCEVAENICRIEEEERNEAFFDLAIWGSPKDLLAPLCTDEP